MAEEQLLGREGGVARLSLLRPVLLLHQGVTSVTSVVSVESINNLTSVASVTCTIVPNSALAPGVGTSSRSASSSEIFVDTCLTRVTSVTRPVLLD